jgi:hypothetical protein
MPSRPSARSRSSTRSRRISRRVFLLSLAAAAVYTAAGPARAHSPYRQWKVLRQRFLLVHSTRTDPEGDELAERLVALLQGVLPQANALVGRSRDEARLAALLSSGQAMLAVLRPDDARDLFLGRAAFAGQDARGLRRLLAVESRILATVESFPRHHAWLVSAALCENAAGLAVRVPRADESAVPVHAGALAYARGEPLEAAE